MQAAQAAQHGDPIAEFHGLRQRLATGSERDTVVRDLLHFVRRLTALLDDEAAPPDQRTLYAHVLGATTLAGVLTGPDPSLGTRRELFARAHDSAVRLGSQAQAAWVDFRQARSLQARGRLEAARELMVEIFERHPEARERELIHRQFLAELLRQLSQHEAALEELDRVDARLELEAGRWLGNEDSARAWHGLRAAAQGSRGQLLGRMGLLDQAAVCFDEEGRQAELAGDADGLATHLLNAADLDLTTERFERARGRLERAREEPWYDDVRPGTRARMTLALGAALSELERGASERPARAALVLHSALADPDLGQLMSVKAETILADLALRAGALDEAERVLVSARARQPEARAVGTLGLHQAILLATQEARLALARQATPQQLTFHVEALHGAYTDLLEQWAATPHRPGGVGFLRMANRRQVVSTLVRLLLAVEGSERGASLALSAVLRAEGLGSLARTRGTPPATLDEIRSELLVAGHGIVVYLPSKERTHVFLLDAENVGHAEIAACDTLASATRDMLGLFLKHPSRVGVGADAARHGELLWSRAQRLGALLLGGEVGRAVVGWRGVTFVGLDMLGGPPVEALVVGERLLGETTAIDRLPSLALGLALVRADRPQRDGGLVLAASLAPDPGLSPVYADLETLEFGRRQVERLTGPWARRPVTVWLDDALTLDALATAPARAASVLQLFAHGLHDNTRERGAMLVLSPSPLSPTGLVTCSDVERHARVSGLVILSACGSARGPARFGDDQLTHLGGAFLGAGARAVLLSRAQLEYEPTLAFSEVLHEQLVQPGMTPARALHLARASLAADGERLAAFARAQHELIGIGHRALRSD